MEIKSQLTNRTGQIFDLVYRDADSVIELGDRTVSAVHGYCFYGDGLVIVFAKAKGYWTLPGGGVEYGESVEDALIREVKEETNMRVLASRLIGYQDIFEINKTVTQTRHFCIVEPYGPFACDPDGEVTEIKLIDPKELPKYVDWKNVGEHLLNRALKLKTR